MRTQYDYGRWFARWEARGEWRRRIYYQLHKAGLDANANAMKEIITMQSKSMDNVLAEEPIISFVLEPLWPCHELDAAFHPHTSRPYPHGGYEFGIALSYFKAIDIPREWKPTF
jgi:hypothetical protein